VSQNVPQKRNQMNAVRRMPARRANHQGEFFKFRFCGLILGLGVKALIFCFFCIKTKEKKAKQMNEFVDNLTPKVFTGNATQHV
jgi:hypothetical protein